MSEPILVQGAMEVEINYIKQNLEQVEKVQIDGYSFFKGSLLNYPIILSETKIGSINATISTLIGIKEFNPKFIINQGVAGGQAKNIHKNDLVIGKACVNSNCFETITKKEGEGSNPLEWNITSFTSDDAVENNNQFIYTDKYLLKKVKELTYIYSKGNVHIGILGSGDAWNKEVDFILYLNKKLDIISADMESIGSYTVAQKYNIPVIGIRTISDNSLLQEDYERATANGAQEFVLELLKKLIEKRKK